ncbi:MAG: RraA family protein [Salipiger thiooxidans]|uniref:RraA family protein n=1 Tax=Salipiger thiooxidans TaxID=282683 RepID=UPI001CFB8291|nr:RraA family protein [Salipiger thiooxidans]
MSALAGLGTATLGEVAAVRIVPRDLRALDPARGCVAGAALTVRCTPGDNLALHLALAQARPGEILVVGYGGDLTTGPFGEIMATAARMAGITGLVIDGCVRDSAQIVESRFPVFCRGTAIPGTTKSCRGEIGTACTIGEVEIRTGDVVVADRDAIVILDPSAIPDALAKGERRAVREAEVMDCLRRGETTCQIFGFA